MTFIGPTTVFSSILVLALLGGLSYYVFWSAASKPLSPMPRRTFSDPARCAEILACRSFNGVRNNAGWLKSRATPNQRLVQAFGINNGFTTIDDRYAKKFRLEAAKRIEMNDSDWSIVARYAHQLVRESIAESGPDYLNTSLDSLVQSMALRLALHVLFDRNPLDLEMEAITTVTRAINNCWVYSKGSDPKYVGLMSGAKKDLKQALAKLFSKSVLTSGSQHNPLNYILPAYETLWRVVLLCFIEVSFRENRQTETAEWRKVLGDFLTDPTQAAFEKSAATDADKTVSVSHIVNEALRLYPPTRRIHRLYQLQESPGVSEILAADIERMQRDDQIWNEPLSFRPLRWLQIGEEARLAFMPFGNKPFVCPARKEFGPRIIGILVAALTVHINPTELQLRYRTRHYGNTDFLSDEIIDTDRDAYESWWIEKK